jgi:hypothetical protein
MLTEYVMQRQQHCRDPAFLSLPAYAYANACAHVIVIEYSELSISDICTNGWNHTLSQNTSRLVAGTYHVAELQISSRIIWQKIQLRNKITTPESQGFSKGSATESEGGIR